VKVGLAPAPAAGATTGGHVNNVSEGRRSATSRERPLRGPLSRIGAAPVLAELHQEQRRAVVAGASTKSSSRHQASRRRRGREGFLAGRTRRVLDNDINDDGNHGLKCQRHRHRGRSGHRCRCKHA